MGCAYLSRFNAEWLLFVTQDEYGGCTIIGPCRWRVADDLKSIARYQQISIQNDTLLPQRAYGRARDCNKKLGSILCFIFSSHRYRTDGFNMHIRSQQLPSLDAYVSVTS